MESHPRCCVARTCCPAPRAQIAHHAALTEPGIAQGTPEVRPPARVMGQGNKKLSARPRGCTRSPIATRGSGGGLLNYLAARLGESPRRALVGGDGRGLDIRGREPATRRASTSRRPTRSAQHMRLLSIDGMTDQCLPFPKAARCRLRPGRRRRPRSAAGARRCRWWPSGSTSSPAVACSASSSSTRPAFVVDEVRRGEAAHRDSKAVVRASYDALRRGSRPGRPQRSRTRCGPASVDEMGLSRARLRPCAVSPCPDAGSRRRCSSRWSCSAASGASGRLQAVLA